ncbi:phosphotransferase [Demequina sp. NBRC 110056]|uniref:phosphotransferase n=1 Tax=Demequina sp. NBRC 110056 TaxID=1570345 RepID=UPI000A025EC1|nr:phosphotransferase [Demequina sp. NBRC 110056]
MSEWIEGTEIARGATAVVRRGRPGTVVKTMNSTVPEIVAELEVRGTRAAMEAGLPVAALLDADLEARPPRLTLQHVPGQHLVDRASEIGHRAVGELLAELLELVHAADPGDAIPAEDFLGHQIRGADMPESVRASALMDLERLTAGADRTLCHMDLHSHNVIWDDGPVIIDWTNAMAAPSAADLARSRLLLETERHSGPPEAWPALDEELEGLTSRAEAQRQGILSASRAWDRVLAAARLDESPGPAERAALLAALAG